MPGSGAYAFYDKKSDLNALRQTLHGLASDGRVN
jgi:hypothetical protein